jgi:broad specificity phosphatase PhoE
MSPAVVYIIRHGEKLGDPASDAKGEDPHLSIQGSARAAAVPSLFAQPQYAKSCQVETTSPAYFFGTYQQTKVTAPAPRFKTPDFIFAAKPEEPSHRPWETVVPLHLALPGVPVNNKIANAEYKKVAEEVLAKFAGKVVLICWHHGHIPQLASALGAKGHPSKWPPEVFDRVWEIGYDPVPTFHDQPQRLLYGDSSS